MSDHTITRATPADLDRIMEIEVACFEDPWPRKSFSEDLDNSAARVLVLCLDGSPDAVAFICYWRVLDEVHIMDIAVHPEYQRRGLAQHLIDHMLLDPHGEGSVARALLEVRPSNKPAIALYLRLGFKEVGQRSRYYPDGEDALVMTLKCKSKLK